MTHIRTRLDLPNLDISPKIRVTSAPRGAPLHSRRTLLALLAAGAATACGQTDDSATTNVQSGTARAPGAAPGPKP